MDSLITQSLQNNENSLIISQIFNIFKGIKWDKNQKIAFLLSLLCIPPKIMAILLMKHILSNIDRAMNNISIFLFNLIYKSESYNSFDPSSFSNFMNNEIRKYAAINSVDSFKLKLEVNPQNSVIYQLRGFEESPIYSSIKLKAMEEFRAKKDGVANCSRLKYDHKKKIYYFQPIIPDIKFPSKDFVKLKGIITKNIESSSKLGSYQVIPLLIDGEPGLGKSEVLNFLAYGTKLSTIKHTDMSDFTNYNLDIDTIFSETLGVSPINGHTLIVIDEIDKYIAGILGNNDNKLEVVKVNQMMLNSILSLIEHNPGTKYNLFIVFCSNNFQTIFDYVNMKHYASMKTRFIKIKFHRIDKHEFKEYLRYLHNKLYEGDFDFYFDNFIKKYYDSLPDNFTITIRDLNQCALKQMRDIEKICIKICKNHHIYSKPLLIDSPGIDIINMLPTRKIIENNNSNVKVIGNNNSNVKVTGNNNSNIKFTGNNNSNHVRINEVDNKFNKELTQIFIDNPPDSQIYKSLLMLLNDENVTDIVSVINFLENGNHISRNLIFNGIPLNNKIFYVLLYKITVLNSNDDEPYISYINKFLEYDFNIKHFIDALFDLFNNYSNFEIEENVINTFCKILFHHPTWIEYVCKNDNGLISLIITWYITTQYPPNIVIDLIKKLELPGSSLIDYYKLQYMKPETLQSNLESLLNSIYLKIYCINDEYEESLVKYAENCKDPYILSLINKLLEKGKKSRIAIGSDD